MKDNKNKLHKHALNAASRYSQRTQVFNGESNIRYRLFLAYLAGYKCGKRKMK